MEWFIPMPYRCYVRKALYILPCKRQEILSFTRGFQLCQVVSSKCISIGNRSQGPAHSGMVQPGKNAWNIIPWNLPPVPFVLIRRAVEWVVNFITSNNTINEGNFRWNSKYNTQTCFSAPQWLDLNIQLNRQCGSLLGWKCVFCTQLGSSHVCDLLLVHLDHTYGHAVYLDPHRVSTTCIVSYTWLMAPFCLGTRGRITAPTFSAGCYSMIVVFMLCAVCHAPECCLEKLNLNSYLWFVIIL